MTLHASLAAKNSTILISTFTVRFTFLRILSQVSSHTAEAENKVPHWRIHGSQRFLLLDLE